METSNIVHGDLYAGFDAKRYNALRGTWGWAQAVEFSVSDIGSVANDPVAVERIMADTPAARIADPVVQEAIGRAISAGEVPITFAEHLAQTPIAIGEVAMGLNQPNELSQAA